MIQPTEQLKTPANAPGVKKPAIRILFVGAGNQGSHARAMSRAFSRLGQIVHEFDPRQYAPITWSGFFLRSVRRMLNRSIVQQLNAQIIRDMDSMEPTLMVVYKGEAMLPATLQEARRRGICCVNVYPDVSVFTHGALIPRCLPLYDHIFTTKSFGREDLYEHFKLTNVAFLPHGFDPEVHRTFDPDSVASASLKCDASFIGTWSPKKEAHLHQVVTRTKDISLKIWGAQWESTKSAAVKACFTGKYVMGILYAVAVQNTKVNIAILSEARLGSSSGDQTTTRTFEIPAAGGFMLHERTEEVLSFYEEDKEVACFGSEAELAEKVKFFLENPNQRERIRIAAHRRCLAENSIDARAQKILDWFWERALPKHNTD